MPKYEFTDEQEVAIGHVVADSFGANLQTGFNERGIPYLAIQRVPNGRIVFYNVHSDGTVMVVSSY